MSQSKGGILFFDGECGLCQRSVRFLLRQDRRRRRLRFAPLQGQTAAAMVPASLCETPSTVVYLTSEGERLLRSTAVLQALIDTGTGWQYPCRLARQVPRRWRDAAYDWVARNRQRFGGASQCALPSPEERAQILP